MKKKLKTVIKKAAKNSRKQILRKERLIESGDAQKCSEMVIDAQKCTEMLIDGQRWSEIVRDGPRWSEMVPEGPRWFQVVIG